MGDAPNPAEIFDRSVEEGRRRLDQSLIELIANGFIAGFTIVFGVVALGIVEAMAEPQVGRAARLLGAVGFGIGVMFLIAGRAELTTENFYDPVATAFDRRGDPGLAARLARLWGVTLALNVVGAGLFALLFRIEGVLPHGASDALNRIAGEVAHRGAWGDLAAGIIGGALVTLLSFLLSAANSVVARMLLAWVVGFLLALGPFGHVIVTALHLYFGILFGAEGVSWATLAADAGLVFAGNLVGGLGLVTLSHIAQAKGAREAGEDEPSRAGGEGG